MGVRGQGYSQETTSKNCREFHRREFHVQWKRSGVEHNAWELENNLSRAQEVIANYSA